MFQGRTFGLGCLYQRQLKACGVRRIDRFAVRCVCLCQADLGNIVRDDDIAVFVQLDAAVGVGFDAFLVHFAVLNLEGEGGCHDGVAVRCGLLFQRVGAVRKSDHFVDVASEGRCLAVFADLCFLAAVRRDLRILQGTLGIRLAVQSQDERCGICCFDRFAVRCVCLCQLDLRNVILDDEVAVFVQLDIAVGRCFDARLVHFTADDLELEGRNDVCCVAIRCRSFLQLIFAVRQTGDLVNVAGECPCLAVCAEHRLFFGIRIVGDDCHIRQCAAVLALQLKGCRAGRFDCFAVGSVNLVDLNGLCIGSILHNDLSAFQRDLAAVCLDLVNNDSSLFDGKVECGNRLESGRAGSLGQCVGAVRQTDDAVDIAGEFPCLAVCAEHRLCFGVRIVGCDLHIRQQGNAALLRQHKGCGVVRVDRAAAQILLVDLDDGHIIGDDDYAVLQLDPVAGGVLFDRILHDCAAGDVKGKRIDNRAADSRDIFLQLILAVRKLAELGLMAGEGIAAVFVEIFRCQSSAVLLNADERLAFLRNQNECRAGIFSGACARLELLLADRDGVRLEQSVLNDQDSVILLNVAPSFKHRFVDAESHKASRERGGVDLCELLSRRNNSLVPYHGLSAAKAAKTAAADFIFQKDRIRFGCAVIFRRIGFGQSVYSNRIRSKSGFNRIQNAVTVQLHAGSVRIPAQIILALKFAVECQLAA